ncbi:MCM3, partial [Hepatospora eriocheir]
MVGGNEVKLLNESRIRGDINILLVGDPSTAKSQLLRYMLKFNPLSIAATKRESTGVGLISAVVLDKETGEKRLEAGAMVLGDRGIVCIDEFDKMDVNDRVAIHEVMEQQTTLIAKASIHTTLNARCSVLAAANPVLGRFDSKKTVQYNVNLPDTLLTRFYLVFITLDTNVNDYDISNHVLKMHADDNRSNNEDIVSSELFKRFINHVKKIRPTLTDDSALLISKSYSKLREDSKGFVIPITPRVLETLIRLSTAHRKLRLSETVDECDVDE